MFDERHILHVDMDAFFAAIEQRDCPELRGKPVLVGGDPNGRGVVSTASYEARSFGCHSAMPMAEAARRCPQATIMPPRMRQYAEVSRQVLDILEQFTPLVEPISIDEAFLDVTGSTRLSVASVATSRRALLGGCADNTSTCASASGGCVNCQLSVGASAENTKPLFSRLRCLDHCRNSRA